MIKQNLKIRDQGANNGCTVYSIVTINNLQNILEKGDSYVQLDPSPIYKQMIAEKPKLKEGVVFKEAIDWMKKKGYIVGYGAIRTRNQIIKAVDMQCFPLTYVTGANRKKTGEQKKINREPCEYGQMKRETYSHAFSIVGYTMEGCICAGTWGEGRGDRGYYTATWADIEKCGDIRAIIDAKEGEKKKEKDARFLGIIKQLSYCP